MPHISRKQLLETLGEGLGAPEAELRIREVLAAAGLPDRPIYRPEEIALVGKALMKRAQAMPQAD